jgi:hypothetical protein
MDAIAAPRPAHDAPGHPRLIGLAVATLIALGVLAAELVVFGTSIMLVSLLIAPYLGWCLGPDAAASRRPARTVIEMAGISVLYGALLVSMAGQVDPYVVWEGPWDRAVDVIGIAIIGLMIFGLPALGLTLACAMAWYAAVRRLATIGRCEVAR